MRSRLSLWFQQNDRIAILVVAMMGVLTIGIITGLDGGSDDKTALISPTVTFGPTLTALPLVCGTCDSMEFLHQSYRCLEAGHTQLDRDGDGVPCESICR
jgi:hypothetical protein